MVCDSLRKQTGSGTDQGLQEWYPLRGQSRKGETLEALGTKSATSMAHCETSQQATRGRTTRLR